MYTNYKSSTPSTISSAANGLVVGPSKTQGVVVQPAQAGQSVYQLHKKGMTLSQLKSIIDDMVQSNPDNRNAVVTLGGNTQVTLTDVTGANAYLNCSTHQYETIKVASSVRNNCNTVRLTFDGESLTKALSTRYGEAYKHDPRQYQEEAFCSSLDKLSYVEAVEAVDKTHIHTCLFYCFKKKDGTHVWMTQSVVCRKLVESVGIDDLNKHCSKQAPYNVMLCEYPYELVLRYLMTNPVRVFLAEVERYEEEEGVKRNQTRLAEVQKQRDLARAHEINLEAEMASCETGARISDETETENMMSHLVQMRKEQIETTIAVAKKKREEKETEVAVVIAKKESTKVEIVRLDEKSAELDEKIAQLKVVETGLAKMASAPDNIPGTPIWYCSGLPTVSCKIEQDSNWFYFSGSCAHCSIRMEHQSKFRNNGGYKTLECSGCGRRFNMFDDPDMKATWRTEL